MPLEVLRLENPNAQQQGPSSQRRVENKPEKRIQQKKSIVLQNHQQGQGKAGVVQGDFSFPHLAWMRGAEVNERNREQK